VSLPPEKEFEGRLMTTQSGKAAGWTRRDALAALAAAAAAPALPALAEAPVLPPALARICIAATASPLPARLGIAAAEGRAMSDLVASLVARLGPGTTDWRAALVASGRRDLAAGDRVEVLGRPLMRTEADVLAAGILLREKSFPSG
jgi:hypothetical protein